MEDTLLTTLTMENHHPSTVLSMDSGSASTSHDELDLEMNHQVVLTRPPDINLPLSAEPSPENLGVINLGGHHAYEAENCIAVPKVGKKGLKKVDGVWGAWLFFTFYFKPVLHEKSKAKVTHDVNGISGFSKSDLQLDVFMVQHDMENMYMWVFKEKPENALGKMQLRSYMNGHSREGILPFPFSVERGFSRSHRMQRKHYRGLSNPQCIHGVEVVPSPSLAGLDEDDLRRWTELTGREAKFTIPPEASDYGSWRNMGNMDYELEKPKANPSPKRLLNGSILNLSTSPGNHSNDDSMELLPVCNKRNKDSLNGDDYDSGANRISDGPHWLSTFTGVLRNVYGPVTAAKTIYEDEQGYLIVMSLPFVDLQRVKVSWRNTLTHGIIKVSCTSTSRVSFIKRNSRTFKLTDPSPEHCPPGEFVREIPLATRIPEDANIEAYYDGIGTVLEILVPKMREAPEEEHEVRVCLRPIHEGRMNGYPIFR